MGILTTRDIPAAVMLAAYKREQPYRHHWPRDPSQGLADPGIVAVLRTLITHVPAYTRRQLDADKAGATVTVPAAPPVPVRPRPVTPFVAGPDRKRLAAGDRDDE